MRSAAFFVGFIALVAATGVAAPPKKEKAILQQIQGKWVRRAHELSFEIKGTSWSEFSEKKIGGEATLTGSIEVLPGREYAVVKASNGGMLWLFPNDGNALAVETFDKAGIIVGDGRVYYRPEFAR